MGRSQPVDYQEMIERAEELIRGGRNSDARRLIADIKIKKVPREQVLAVANLARRTGQASRALEYLWPIVGPDRPLRARPTSDELGEYAVALLSLGSYQEAISILEKAQSAAPQLVLYTGFANMTQWNYDRAVDCFERFLSLEGIPPYRLVLAQVNLAASLIALGDSSAAKPLLKEILATSKSNDWRLFYKNALELSAQLAAHEKNWKQADAFLDKITEESAPNKNDLFVHKWRALIDLYRSNGTKQSLAKLMNVRSEAEMAGHWETVRDCDYHRALVTKDKPLFLHVYFGSPFPAYRAKMEKSAKGWLDIPHEYVWSFDGRRTSRVFDLQNARERDGSAVKMKPGKSLHRALRILSADFYRPILLGSLHARLFHDEYFNPETGSLRVHKVLSRLREWLSENNIPVEIVSRSGGFRLVGKGDYGFLISRNGERPPADRTDFQILLDQLKANWPVLVFSSTEAAQFLEMSERSARDLLRWGVERGYLARTGSGRATRYAFIG